MKRVILYLLILLTTTANAAWRPPVVNFSADTRMGGSQNWKIAQAENGWLYFANNEGLLEYNGHDWSIHPLDYYSTVRSVEYSPDGRIYVGGRGEIGYFAPDDMGRLTYNNLSHQLPEGVNSFNEVWNIHANQDHVYFQLRRNIFILDKHEEFKLITSQELILASCLMNNSLYYATTSGFYVMGDSEPIAIRVSENIPYSEVAAMVQYDNNKILIATTSHGLFLYDNGRVRPFVTTGDKLLCENQIFSLDVNHEYIACGTVKGGVVTMDRNGRNAEQHSLRSGMSNNTVLSVLLDSSDNLWCGLDNGIDYLLLSSPIRLSEVNREFRFSGYCTLLDPPYLYMGTNQGLIRVNHSEDMHMLQLSEEQPDVISGSEGQVWNIQKVGGKVFCCHTRGLFLVDPIDHNTTIRPIFTNDGVWNIVPIDENTMIAGSYEGVIKISHNGAGDYTTTRIEGYLGSVRDIKLLPHLQIGYFVSEHGLEQLQFNADYTEAKSQRLIESTTFDTKLINIDNQIIAYTPQQIYHISDDGSLHPTNKYDTLFNVGEIYSMISVDDKKNIWYVSGDNLLRRQYNSAEQRYDDEPYMIMSDQRFFIHGFTRIDPIDSQHYIINGVEGFSIIDSEWKHRLNYAIKPYIIGIYDTRNRNSLLLSNAYGVDVNEIKLPYKSNSIQIIFGSNKAHDNTTEYSFMLKGSDSEWSQWRKSSDNFDKVAFNQKEYTQLFEGKYTFLLRLREPSGEVVESELDIIVLPPWQRTTLMYLLYTLLFVGLFLYLRSRLIRHYADRRRLIELQSERQIEQQKRHYESQAFIQENKIIKLKNEKLESEVLSKSAELSNLMLNKLEKNDIITTVQEHLRKIKADALSRQHSHVVKRVTQLEESLEEKLIDNIDWSTFEENFNITNNDFVKKLQEHYSWMSVNERKLCIYIKMGLQNKEISPLLNLSVRGVEMLRYRVRRKMELDRNENLYEFLQRFS